MQRSILVFLALTALSSSALAGGQITRERITGDVTHYGFMVRIGSAPNAVLHIHRVVRERAPWLPRRSSRAIMLLHGDFATFITNFAPTLGNPPSSAPGMAAWLAERDIDVWGVDRRFTNAPEDGDVSDFEDMGVEQELDDIGVALAFARAIRLATDASLERMTLSGFSRGGELAYFYASKEAALPSWQRHLKGLVPLDVYVSLAPEDEEYRQYFCGLAADEYAALAAGFADAPNSFQITVGQGQLTDPDGPDATGFFPGRTNHQVFLILAGRTWAFFAPSFNYHLNAPVLGGGRVVGLRVSSEDDIARWFAGAPPHSSMREAADTDALTCGDAPLPADVPLSRIRVPLLLIAAAGGYGDRALYSTTQVGSTDVTTLVIRQLPVEREEEDFGHGDLLYSPDAPALAWQPLLSWLQQH